MIPKNNHHHCRTAVLLGCYFHTGKGRALIHYREHPLWRGGVVVGDDLINPEDVAASPRGFVPGLDFNQKQYDETDAGALIPSMEINSPRLFTPKNKPLSRTASAEAGITVECPCEEKRPAVSSM